MSTTLYEFFFGKKESPVMPYGKRPVTGSTARTDMTGGFGANVNQLQDIYHGRDNRYNLAQDLIYTPISRSVQLIGIPVPDAGGDAATQEAADRVCAQFSDEFAVIEQSKLLCGTAWRFAKWDAQNNTLALETIKDDSIVAMDISLVSGEIMGIWTNDTYRIMTDATTSTELIRKRHITKQRIDITWAGDSTGRYKDSSTLNRFGILPRPFGHECDSGEFRGTGVIMQNMRMLKTYHDINRNECQILSEFVPKWVQHVDNVDAWFNNNGFDKDTAIEQAYNNAFSSKFMVNTGEETSEYIFLPSDATKCMDDKLDKLRTAFIAASPIPEVFYGNMITGNEASVTLHKALAVSYIDSLRKENTAPYEDLFNDCLRILSFVESRQYGEVKIKYNAINLMSESEKASVFVNVITGVSKIVEGIGGTPDDMFYFIKGFYPDLPEQDIKAYMNGLDKTIDLKARSNTDAGTLADIQGGGSSQEETPAKEETPA